MGFASEAPTTKLYLRLLEAIDEPESPLYGAKIRHVQRWAIIAEPCAREPKYRRLRVCVADPPRELPATATRKACAVLDDFGVMSHVAETVDDAFAFVVWYVSGEGIGR